MNYDQYPKFTASADEYKSVLLGGMIRVWDKLSIIVVEDGLRFFK